MSFWSRTAERYSWAHSVTFQIQVLHVLSAWISVSTYGPLIPPQKLNHLPDWDITMWLLLVHSQPYSHPTSITSSSDCFLLGRPSNGRLSEAAFTEMERNTQGWNENLASHLSWHPGRSPTVGSPSGWPTPACQTLQPGSILHLFILF